MRNIKYKLIANLTLLVIIFAIAHLNNSSLHFLIPFVFAHCDTLDGPVVQDARAALEKGNVTPVLKWVKKDAEAEVRAAFQTALTERAKSAEAKKMPI